MNTYTNYSVEIVELSFLLAISVQYSDYSKDIGIIEFISKNINNSDHIRKNNSRITPPVKNVSRIVHIVESIIWYYGNTEKRLEIINNKVNMQNFHEYFESTKSSSLKVYNDALILIKGNKSQKIEFDKNFYLSYERDILLISSYYEKSIKEVTFGPIEDILDILELIYLKSLSWKFNNKLLLHIEKVLDLERKQRVLNFPKEITKEEMRLKPITYPKEVFISFSEYLKKDEQIQLLYMPRKIFPLITMVIISISLIAYSYFAIFSLINFSIETLLMFLGICSIFIVGLISFLIQKSIKYIFTSQRIILSRQKLISFIPYNIIIGVTYSNKIFYQNIEIHLKNPIKDLNLGEITKINIKPPKKLNLSMKILSLTKTSERKIQIME